MITLSFPVISDKLLTLRSYSRRPKIPIGRRYYYKLKEGICENIDYKSMEGRSTSKNINIWNFSYDADKMNDFTSQTHSLFNLTMKGVNYNN